MIIGLSITLDDGGFRGDPSLVIEAQFARDLEIPVGFAFSRPGGQRHFDSGGLFVDAASGVAAFDHDPALSNKSLGYKPEGARENGIRESWDLTDAVWPKTGSPTTTVGASNDGPDDTSDYTEVRNITDNDSMLTGGSSLSADNVRCENSFFIRKIAGDNTLRIRNPNNTTRGDWRIDMTVLPDDVWVYIDRNHAAVTIITEFSAAVSLLAGWLLVRFEGAGDVLDFDIAFAQQEEGQFSSSSIKTNGAAVTRSATLLDADSLAGQLNQTAFTFVLRGRLNEIDDGAIGYLFEASDGGTTDRIGLRTAADSSTLDAFSVHSADTDGDTTQTMPTAYTDFGVCITGIDDDFRISIDGSGGTDDTDVAFPLADAFTDLKFGTLTDGALPMFGTIAVFLGYNVQKSDAEADTLAVAA